MKNKYNDNKKSKGDKMVITIFLLNTLIFLLILATLTSCGKVKVQAPQNYNVNHTIKIDDDTLDRIEIICENNSATNEETLSCIDKLVSAYNTNKDKK